MGKKRKRFMKRVMTLVLVFCMVMGVVPPFIRPMEVKASTNEHMRDDAVQWAQDQVGKDEDMDGYYGAQCVDLIVAYYIYLGKPRPLTDISHSAKDFLQDGSGRRPTEWSRYVNDGQTTPQKGDIVVFNAGAYGYSKNGPGHIGIVVDVNVNLQKYYYIDYNACGHNAGFSGPLGHPNYDKEYPKKGDKYTCHKDICPSKIGGDGQIREKALNVFSGLIRPDWPYSPPTPPAPPKGTPLPEGASQTLSNGDYLIVSALSGDRFNPGDYCLSADAYRNNVQIGYRIGEPLPIYTVTWLNNGFYSIKDKYSDKYLEVKDISLDIKANVQQHSRWPEDPGGTKNSAQQWRINETNDGRGGYTLQARCSSYYLDVDGGSLDVGTNIQVWEGNDGLPQRWFFIPWGGGNSARPEIADGEYQIVPKMAQDKALNAQGNGVVKGTNIILWPCKGDARHTFSVKWLGEGYYEIVNKFSNLSLDVCDGLSKNGTNVQLWQRSDVYSERWLIKSCGDGYYNIISKCNGLYLDLAGGYTTDEINIQVCTGWGIGGGDAQKWKFEPFVPTVEAESVTLDKNTLTLKVDEQSSLAATINPTNATNKTLTWTSSNPSVAEVSYGQVRAKAVGTATITATSANGKTATCQVTVQEKDAPPHTTHEYGSDWQFDGNSHWKTCTVCGAKTEESAHGFAQKSDETKHWKVCSCGAKSGEAEHTFAWVIDTAATQESEGVKHEECRACNYKRNEGTKIEKLSPEHTTHEYGSDWQSDGEKHWKACVCGEKTDESAHGFAWVIDQAATQESEGVKHEECGTCGYKRNEGMTIEKLPTTEHTTHEYGSDWQSDGNSHWKACTVCGAKSGEAEHTFVWVIDQAATTESAGVKHEECGTCGYKRNEGTTIEKLPATGGDGGNSGSTPSGGGDNSGSTSSGGGDSSGSTPSGGNNSGSAPSGGGNNSGSTPSGGGNNSGSAPAPSGGDSSGSAPAPSGGDSSGNAPSDSAGSDAGKPETNPSGGNETDAPTAQAPTAEKAQKPNQAAQKQEIQKEPEQSDGKPFIKGAGGKVGWDMIRTEEEKAEKGSIINVNMGKTLVVPRTIFDGIKDKDVTLAFDMGNGILWSVDGKSVTAEKAGDIDFNVKTGVDTIPAELVSGVAGTNYSTQISIAHDGEFGFTAVLSINVGKQNKGLTASLYYYRQNAKELELVTRSAVSEDGTTSFALSHASEYVIVVEAQEEEKKEEPIVPKLPETTEQKAENVIRIEEEGKESLEIEKKESKAWLFLVGAFILAGAGITVAQAQKKKKEQD